MKITETKWAIINTDHPNSKKPVFFSDTLSVRKKDAIEKFLNGSPTSWEEWQKDYNYRAAKVRITIEEVVK